MPTPTRVKYDGLAPGTHTWVYEETDLVCPEHGGGGATIGHAGLLKVHRGTTFDLATETCLEGMRLGEPCGKKGKHTGVFRVQRQVDVYPGSVLEVRDLNDPHSDRAYIVRDHIARGVASVVTEEKAAPAVKSKS